jgi:hypothetical protein
LTGGALVDQFAFMMRRGGLLNADKYEELLISAAATFVGGKQTGSAYVLLGQPTASTSPPEIVDLTTSPRIRRIDGATTNVAFGVGLAGLGDINGDGIPEFAIGDSLRPSATEVGVGELYIFSLAGTAPKTTGDALAIISNDLIPAKDNWFGGSLANGADIDPAKGTDLNKDGFADIVVEAWRTADQQNGSARLFLGKTGSLAGLKATGANYVFLPGTGGTTSFASSLHVCGDVNGDGFSDLAITEANFNSNTGRIVVYY